jgi:hypothetical protein
MYKSKRAQKRVISDKRWRYATEQHENGRVATAELRLIFQKMCTENGESYDHTLDVSKKLILWSGLWWGGRSPMFGSRK